MGEVIKLRFPRPPVAPYRLPELGKVYPGNSVMLKSGGPEMIVDSIEPDGRIRCLIPSSKKLNTTEIFPLECLTCFGAR